MRNWAGLTSKRYDYVLKFFVHQMFSKVIQILLINQFLDFRSTKLIWALASLNKIKVFSLTKVRDRCFLTGTAKSYSRLTGLSRHFTRYYIKNGILSELTSASW